MSRSRSRARGWAVQLLYAWETRGGDQGLVPLLEEFERTRRIATDSREYLRRLIAALDEYLPEVDHALDSALLNWRLERLSIVDRSILRLASVEMLHLSVPPRVAIQEALRLAEKYSTAESPRFINGVLDALMRREGVNSGRGGEPR